VRVIGEDPFTQGTHSSNLLSGTYQIDNKDHHCKLKISTNSKREKEILQQIVDNSSLEERNRYVVTWLHPSGFMPREKIYFLNQSGELITPPASVPSPFDGLVFESGEMNLKEFLECSNHGSVPLSQRVHILEEVVKAVEFLHRVGIVHFDLKPENIVCFSSNSGMRWKLIDFGSSFKFTSKPPPQISHAGEAWLTAEYTSPEVMRVFSATSTSEGLPVTPSMDIWSLGLIAFFLLTKHPFWKRFSHQPFTPSLLSNASQGGIQTFLKQTFNVKERSFLESCLLIDPTQRFNATELLKKTLFTSGNPTIQANTLILQEDSFMVRLIEKMSEYQAVSQDLICDELKDQMNDVAVCLSSQLDRFRHMTSEEIQILKGSQGK
jgi:serine/threonine protein kinase